MQPFYDRNSTRKYFVFNFSDSNQLVFKWEKNIISTEELYSTIFFYYRNSATFYSIFIFIDRKDLLTSATSDHRYFGPLNLRNTEPSLYRAVTTEQIVIVFSRDIFTTTNCLMIWCQIKAVMYILKRYRSVIRIVDPQALRSYSFVDRCLSVWPLHCLFFFDLRILITPWYLQTLLPTSYVDRGFLLCVQWVKVRGDCSFLLISLCSVS